MITKLGKLHCIAYRHVPKMTILAWSGKIKDDPRDRSQVRALSFQTLIAESLTLVHLHDSKLKRADDEKAWVSSDNLRPGPTSQQIIL